MILILRKCKRYVLGLLLIALVLIFIFVSYEIFLIVKNIPLNKIALAVSKAEWICKDCNVVMVSLDTLSANHMPCYGYNRDTSPNLCTFANDNIFFQNAYTNASWTLPSHVSVFTGLFDYHNGKYVNGNQLSPSIPLFPEILKNMGYKVMFFIPPDDSTLPIDEVYGRLGDSVYDNVKYDWNTSIDMFKKSVESGNKTFMFLHTYEVHDPYIIGGVPQIYQPINTKFPTTWEEFGKFSYTSEFVNRVISDVKNGIDSDWLWRQHRDVAEKLFPQLLDSVPDYQKEVSVLEKMREAGLLVEYEHDQNLASLIDKNNLTDVSTLKALYDQTINQLDEGRISMLTNLINDPDFKDNTILVIFSDHGEEFMEHGHLWHETVYNSNLKIPLIMHIPGVSNAKVTSAVQLVDIVPTLSEILGIKTQNKYDGKSLLGKIYGYDYSNNEVIVSDDNDLVDKTIIYWPWKLFLGKQSDSSYIATGLYNIEKDPGETNNVLFQNQDVEKEIINLPSLQDINIK